MSGQPRLRAGNFLQVNRMADQRLTVNAVAVGDTMRISVELIKQIDRLPEHASELVKLVEVRVEADGSKTLVLERIR